MSEPVVLVAGRLRIGFEQRGDRWLHWIERAAMDGPLASPTLARLESIEGTPDDPWPPSPPLQSLHLEDRPDGVRVALLVGMAGNSHWSMSVEIDPRTGAALFDVACRFRALPRALGSTYRVFGAASSWHVEPLAAESRTMLELGTDELSFRPEIGNAAWPHTVRWRYRIQ